MTKHYKEVKMEKNKFNFLSIFWKLYYEIWKAIRLSEGVMRGSSWG